MGTVSPDRQTLRHDRLLSGGVASLLGVAMLSGLALLLTNDGCSGDGSFEVFQPRVTRSSYCSTLNLPHLPNSARGIGLAFLLFILPWILVLVATLVAIRSDRYLRLVWFALPAVTLTALSFLLIPLAHVHYLGVGWLLPDQTAPGHHEEQAHRSEPCQEERWTAISHGSTVRMRARGWRRFADRKDAAGIG